MNTRESRRVEVIDMKCLRRSLEVIVMGCGEGIDRTGDRQELKCMSEPRSSSFQGVEMMARDKKRNYI